MSTYIYGNLNVKNNIVGVNYPAEVNADTGLIMQLNLQNVTDYEYAGNLVAATFNTATVNEAVDIGWAIELVNTGEKKRIIGVSGFIVTVEAAWSVAPLAGDPYRLFKKTGVALIYKPASKQMLLGYTNNKSGDTSVNVYGNLLSAQSPVPFASNILVNNRSFVTVFSYAWNTSLITAVSANMAIYVNTTNSIDIAVTDGITTYGSGTYGATGNYIMPVTAPVTPVVINLQVKGGRGLIVSAVMIF